LLRSLPLSHIRIHISLKEGSPYRATGHNKENKGLVSSRLLIGRVEMETDREVARRKPLAAGLAACLYRGTDGR